MKLCPVCGRRVPKSEPSWARYCGLACAMYDAGNLNYRWIGWQLGDPVPASRSTVEDSEAAA